MSHTCLSCLHCRITLGGERLKCCMGEWLREVDDQEKVVRLRDQERVFFDIGHRKVFGQARECPVFSDMDL
jgi:hypothetical protein